MIKETRLLYRSLEACEKKTCTEEKYFDPLGRSINEWECVPDITAEKVDNARKDIKKALNFIKEKIQNNPELQAKFEEFSINIDFDDTDEYIPLMLKESKLDNSLKNKKSGALGYFQIMPAAFEDVKERFGKYLGNISYKDPVENCVCGILFYHLCTDHYIFSDEAFSNLDSMTDGFDQERLALMIYNAGIGTVRTLWKATGAESFDDFESIVMGRLDDQLGVGEDEKGKKRFVTDNNFGVCYEEHAAMAKYKELVDKAKGGDKEAKKLLAEPFKLLAEENGRFVEKEVVVKSRKGDLKIPLQKIGEMFRYARIISELELAGKTFADKAERADKAKKTSEAERAKLSTEIPSGAPNLESTDVFVKNKRQLWSMAETLKNQGRETGVFEYGLTDADKPKREEIRKKLIQLLFDYNKQYNPAFKDIANESQIQDLTQIFIPNLEYVKANYQGGASAEKVDKVSKPKPAPKSESRQPEKTAVAVEKVPLGEKYPLEIMIEHDKSQYASRIPEMEKLIYDTETEIMVLRQEAKEKGTDYLDSRMAELFMRYQELQTAMLAEAAEVDRKVPYYADDPDGRLAFLGDETLTNKYGFNETTDLVRHDSVDRRILCNTCHGERSETKYIVLHSTAGEDTNYFINHTVAHYLVGKDGKIHYLIDRSLEDNHAGNRRTDGVISETPASWDGDEEMSYKAIGIEVVANPGEEWNDEQYEAVKKLTHWLGSEYGIKKRNVLMHNQVAFATKWGIARGRKPDPYGVDWEKLDLPNNSNLIDVDVVKGKIEPNIKWIKENMAKSGGDWFGVPEETIRGLEESAKMVGDPAYMDEANRVSKRDEIEAKYDIVSYTVKHGDNLSSIADKHGCNYEDIEFYNDLKTRVLSTGQKLKVPKAKKL